MSVSGIFRGLHAPVAFACLLGAALPLSAQAPQEEPTPTVTETIQVTATRTPEDVETVPASVTVISGDDLAARGAIDLPSALALAAGVSVAPGGENGPAGSVPEIWGLRELDAFLLVVDGVPWGGAFNPALPSLDLANVDRIEILRGSAPVLFGATSFFGVIHVIHRAGKLGLGTAILTGMKYAIDGGFDYFLNLDADFSHPPRFIPALLAGMAGNDVMIGSRYVPGGGYIGWPLSRVVMSRGVNLLVRLLMRLPARDCSGGYRCYRVDLLRRARLERVRSTGYSFEEEVLYRCRKAGGRIGEAPIVFEERRAGASKVDPREVVRSMSLLVWLGLQALFGDG